MSKREHNLELKIYEILGIKKFRDLIFAFVNFLFVKPVSKHVPLKDIDSLTCGTNYRPKKGYDIKNLKEFKKSLLTNTFIHIFAIGIIIFPMLKSFGIISGTISISSAIFESSIFVINVYCIMLQRYNWIRINNIINKYEKNHETKSRELKEEILKKDKKLNKHKYVLIKGKRQKDVAIENLVQKASYDELIEYRKYLEDISQKNDYLNFINGKNDFEIDEVDCNMPLDEKSYIKVIIEKEKVLKK